MNKDYKIGIVVGLLVLIFGSGYFLLTNSKDQPEPPAEENKFDIARRLEESARPSEPVATESPRTTTPDWNLTRTESPARIEPTEPTARPGLTELSSLPDLPTNEPAAPSADDTTPEEQDASASPGIADIRPGRSTDEQDATVTPGLSPLPSGTTTETTTPSPAATTDRLPSEPEEGNLWQLDADADLALKEKDPEPTITNLTAVPSPATAEPRPAQPRLSPLSSPPPSSTPVRDISTIRPSISGGTPNTYTVQKGDLGYWMIAEKVYGPGMGKHWPRIAEANNVDTGKLRPGMVLKIPSLPSETARASTSAGGLTASRAEVEANYGKTISSNGRREYVVGPDDSTGFWGISQKVYGAGKYASLLQNANPGVDSTKLRAGMRLNVPPKPAESTTPTRAGASTSSTDTAGHGRITNVAGRKYYVVKSQDTLGGIAQSVYGSSRYYPVIEKANPEIDPLTIQPGDRLLIPPKPASPPPSSPVGSVPSGGTSPSGIPEPDFGG